MTHEVTAPDALVERPACILRSANLPERYVHGALLPTCRLLETLGDASRSVVNKAQQVGERINLNLGLSLGGRLARHFLAATGTMRETVRLMTRRLTTRSVVVKDMWSELDAVAP